MRLIRSKNETVAALFHAPRTAGTAMAKAVEPYVLRSVLDHNGHAVYAEAAHAIPIGTPIYCGVRCPWDRAVSLAAWYFTRMLQCPFDDLEGFLLWVRTMEDRPRMLAEQVEFHAGLCNLLRFEHLDEDWEVARQKWKVGFPLERHNWSERAATESYYDGRPDLVALVEELWPRDCSTLGYSWNAS